MKTVRPISWPFTKRPPALGGIEFRRARSTDLRHGRDADRPIGPRSGAAVIDKTVVAQIDINSGEFLGRVGVLVSSEVRDLVVQFKRARMAGHGGKPLLDEDVTGDRLSRAAALVIGIPLVGLRLDVDRI